MPPAPFTHIKFGDALAVTDEGAGVIRVDASGSGASAVDGLVWLPLTTTVGGDDVLVFDADHSLIPTLVVLA